MDECLEIPSTFDSRAASRWFEAWARHEGAENLRLGLPEGAFLHPAGIVLLASGIASRRARGLSTSLLARDGSADAYRYLQRIDFFSELGVAKQEEFQRHPESGRFVPLRCILDLATARRLADQAADLLEERLPDVGPSPLRMARFVFEELGANVVQHSRAPETGFGMAQAYPQGRRIQIAFADSGVGFLASLQRNPELAGRIEDEGEALQLALGRAVSSHAPGRGHMGMGLALLVQFADLLGGDLEVASGDALLHRRTSLGRERVSVLRKTSGWRGTWICLDAQLP